MICYFGQNILHGITCMGWYDSVEVGVGNQLRLIREIDDFTQ